MKSEGWVKTGKVFLNTFFFSNLQKSLSHLKKEDKKTNIDSFISLELLFSLSSFTANSSEDLSVLTDSVTPLSVHMGPPLRPPAIAQQKGVSIRSLIFFMLVNPMAVLQP